MMPLSWTETDSDKTNLKLEALWILINLSYNDGGDLFKLFDENHNYDFVKSMELVMSQSLSNFQLFDQFMYLMSNMTADKRTRLLVKQHFDLTKFII